MRQVTNLKWARRLPVEWPPGIPRPRPRGVKALGRRYETALGKALPQAEPGIWWEFFDTNGPGLCQTDFILASGHRLLVLECKHTWTVEGMAQLAGLYLPVVSLAAERPAAGVQVCKHLVPWAGASHQSLADAWEAARLTGLPATLHWRGLMPLQHQTPTTPVATSHQLGAPAE